MIFLTLAFVAAVSAACSDNTKCAACAAATGCGWCDFGAAGSCMETATLDLGCSAPSVKTANGGTCPDKCAAVNVTAPGNCKLAADWKPQFAAACNPINMVATVGSTTMYTGTTGTTAAPDKCSMAYVKDGAACLAAVASFSCSYGCQKCTDASSPIKLCKKVCDGLKAKCPTVVTDCPASPFSDALCAAADTDCADTTIEGTVAAGPTAAPTTTPAAGGSTTTTVAIVEGDCKQTTCTACASAKCIWCAGGMTSETAGLSTSCIAANATCTSGLTAYNETAKCVYDQNNACEKLTTCATCAADAKCSWCDTGAAAGGLVSTGSCNRGTTCKTGVTPTKATECSASTFAVAFFAVFGAILAAL